MKMSHPIFSEIPVRYHDRIDIHPDGTATVTVEDGPYTVPTITSADRAAIGVPSGLRRDRRDLDRPAWYPPVH